VIEEMMGVQAGGRHALDEDAFQTPIFHALSRGGRRRQQQEGTTASLEEFRRDPLTAPIPVQALAPMPSIRERLQAAGRRDRSAAAESWGRRERSAPAPREWAGLTALAERGRHRLATSNW
jgi:hypothetical protein